MATWSYDSKVDALYVKLSDHAITDTTELSHFVIADRGGQGEVVGVEILGLSQLSDLTPLAPLLPEAEALQVSTIVRLCRLNGREVMSAAASVTASASLPSGAASAEAAPAGSHAAVG